MTLIEQQRLIGAVLLLVIISVVSYFLISSANNVTEDTETVQSEQSFTSVVEPISEPEVEIVEYVDETLLDPQNLAQRQVSVQSETVDIKDSEIISDKIKSIDKVTDQSASTSEEEVTVTTTSNWILQLGSFSVKNNADALVSQLKKLGYQPTIETSETDKGTIYRVRLADIKTETIATKLANDLAKKLNLSPQVFQQKS